MDKLKSLGLTIDKDEKLKILSIETREGSMKISNLTKLLIANTDQALERLDKTRSLIQVLDEQTSSFTILKLAVRISKIMQSRK